MRIFDRVARKQTPKQYPGGFIFAHVLPQKNVHLLCPVRDAGSSGVLGQCLSVLERERQIVESVLRDDGGMRQPSPAMVGISEEFLIHEREHLPLLIFIGNLRV